MASSSLASNRRSNILAKRPKLAPKTGAFAKRCRESLQWGAESVHDQAPGKKVRPLSDAVATDRTSDAKVLPRSWAEIPPGCTVTITVTVPPDQQGPVPVLDFAKLYAQQYKDADVSQEKHSPPPDESKPKSIGSFDVLSRTIRSMEGRLANHGILAAPSTILGRTAKKKYYYARKQEDQEYYKVDDDMGDFIDDSLLDSINTDDMRGDNGDSQIRNGADESDITNGREDEPDDWSDRPNVNPFGFRLEAWDDPMTDTPSELSEIDNASDDESAGPKPGTCTWQERLVALVEEIIWLREDGQEIRGPTADDSIVELNKAFQVCCETFEKAQGDEGACVDALRVLQGGLPALLRPASRKGHWRTAAIIEVTHDKRSNEGQLQLFSLTMGEEISWAIFCWRLLRFTAGDFKRSKFVRYWLTAAREPQKEWMREAQARWVEHARKVLPDSNFPKILEKIRTAREASFKPESEQLLRPLFDILRHLWQQYIRSRFWASQRNLQSFEVMGDTEFVKLRMACINFTTWATAKLNDLLGFQVPRNLMVKLLSTRVAANCTVVPLQLPVSIFVKVNEVEIKGTLECVKSMTKQTVKLSGLRGELKEFHSLYSAGVWALKQTSAQQALHNLLNEDGGSWKLFSMMRGKTPVHLNMFTNLGYRRGVAPFQNPLGMPRCPVFDQNFIGKHYRRTLDRREFLSDLSPGLWVSCKCAVGQTGAPGQYYNVLVSQVHRDQESRACNSVRVRWIDGEMVDVPATRLEPVYIYLVGDKVGVYDRGQVWQGKIDKIYENANELAKTMYDIDVGGRIINAAFDLLRREDQGSKISNRASVKAKSKASTKSGVQGRGSSIAVSASSVASSSGQDRQHGRAHPQVIQTQIPTETVKLLMKGQPCRVRLRNTWGRGTVMSDDGGRGVQVSQAGGKIVVVPRGDVEALPTSRPRSGTHQASSGSGDIIDLG